MNARKLSRLIKGNALNPAQRRQVRDCFTGRNGGTYPFGREFIGEHSFYFDAKGEKYIGVYRKNEKTVDSKSQLATLRTA